jgi:nucleotide-binding universal stress UspA family protein
MTQPNMTEQKKSQPKVTEPKTTEQKKSQPKTTEPKKTEQKTEQKSEQKWSEPKTEQKMTEPKTQQKTEQKWTEPKMTQQTMAQPTMAQQNVMNEPMAQNWLVAIDDSVFASYAFNYATEYMNRQIDHLFIFNVHDEPTVVYGGYATPELIQNLHEVEERRSKKILVHYGHKAKEMGIKYTMMKGSSANAGELICKAVKQYNIHNVVTGRREMGDFKRFFVGSTSKYIVENAECNVIVVKISVGPEEEHVDKSKIIQAEEAERIRRIVEEEDEKRKAEEERKETFAKVKALEEKERADRISQAQMVFNKDNMDKMIHVFAFHEELKKKVH